MALCWLSITIIFILSRRSYSESQEQVYISINGTYIGHKFMDKTFYEAERYCEQTYGTKLASIHSVEQANEMYELLSRVNFYSHEYSWIGLTDENFYGHIYWTDGQPYNFSGANLVSAKDRHCWLLQGIAPVWVIGYCDRFARFICNTNPSWTQPVDVSFMPPINVLGTSIDGSMTLFNHNATFLEADAYCQRMLGTHLISIANYEQAEQAQELCSRTSIDTLCWIGLTQMFQNAYEWTDGNDIGYYRWDINADSSYECTAIKSNGHSTIYSWTTNHCFHDAFKTILMCATYPPTPNPTEAPTESPISSNPTEYPSIAPTLSPYNMIEVTGNYLCSELADRVAIFYDISYEECITECKHNYGEQCTMINHRYDTNPSRCYIFDKQCTINSNIGVSRVAFMGWKHFCVNYPIDWNDINGDACYGYTDVLGYCHNGNISVTVSEIESKATDFSGIESCCGCGGGAELIDDIIISYGEIEENNYDLLCEWNYGNPGNTVYQTWDNIMLYNLCQRLHDRINSTVNEINCNQFIDSSYSGDISFISCDFNDYDRNNDELYFLFLLNKNTVTSAITTYINPDWFRLTQTLLPKTLNTMSYSECVSSLWTTPENIIYAVAPCEGDIITTTSELPTYAPTVNIITNKPTISVLPTEEIIIDPTTIIDTKAPTRKPTNRPKISSTSTTIKTDNTDSTTSVEIDGYIVKTDDNSDNVILILILLVVIFVAIVIIGNIIYTHCKKTSGNENVKTTETDALRVQMSNMKSHVIQTHTPTDDKSDIDNDTKPLPKGWCQVVAPDKRVYYQNNITKETQWERPLK
eukprot:83175_1